MTPNLPIRLAATTIIIGLGSAVYFSLLSFHSEVPKITAFAVSFGFSSLVAAGVWEWGKQRTRRRS